jgi:hypothetical protein
MRESLPGSVPMPYGWTEALTRARLTDVTTRSVLTETPAPLSAERLDGVVRGFRTRIERMSGVGHGHDHVVHTDEEWLDPEDLAVWKQLLDPDGPHFLGRRRDLAVLSVRSVHLGHAPR